MRFPSAMIASLATALTVARALPGQAPRGFTDCDLSWLTSSGLFIRGATDPWERVTHGTPDRSDASQRRAPARRRGAPAAVDSMRLSALDSLLLEPRIVPERPPLFIVNPLVGFTTTSMPAPLPRSLGEYARPCTAAPR